MDARILAGINECPLTGLERGHSCKALTGLPGVRAYLDHVGRLRLVYRDAAGLLLEPMPDGRGYIIAGVYTAPHARRLGYARSLIWTARRVMGLCVEWDDHQTTEGALLRAAVG